MNEAGSCIVRRDRTVLLECGHPGCKEAGRTLGVFAELIKSPPAYHTYRITPLSLWNAAALGCTADMIIERLRELSRWAVPAGLEEEITLLLSRYGRLTLHSEADHPEAITLKGADSELLDELIDSKGLAGIELRRTGPLELSCHAVHRGS
jgi:DNA excision repair protein ERCC-3